MHAGQIEGITVMATCAVSVHACDCHCVKYPWPKDTIL